MNQILKFYMYCKSDKKIDGASNARASSTKLISVKLFPAVKIRVTDK